MATDPIARAFVEVLPDVKRFAGQLGSQLKATSGSISASIGQTVENAGRSLQAAGAHIQRAGTTLTKNVTLPIVATATAITKVGATFEAEMSKIVGLVGVSKGEVQGFSDVILTQGPKWGRPPEELARAMFFVTSAGFRGAEALSVLEAAAKASSAGLGDTEVVADAVTSAVNAYGIENLSAAEATDVLVAAVREGKLEASALAPVLGRLLPTASAMGVSFHDVAGILAVMSRTGLDAAEASTSLGAVMATLLKPTAQARETLEGAGLNMQQLRDMAAQPGGLIEVMRLLDESFAGNDEALAAVIPNVRAFRGVMNVLAQDSAIVDSVMSGVANATGSLDQAFAAAQETAQFKMNAAMAEFKAALVVLSADVLPLVVDGIQRLVVFLGRAVDMWKQLSPETRRFILLAAGVAAAVGPVLLIVGKLVSMVGGLVVVIGKIIPLMGGLALPLIAVGAAIAALVASSPELRATLGETFQRIHDAVKPVLPVIQGLVKQLGGAFMGVLRQLATAATPIVVTLGSLAERLIPMLVSNFSSLLNVMLPVVGVIGGLLVKAVDALRPVVAAAADVFVTLAEVASEIARQVFPIVAAVITAVVDAVSPLLPKLGQLVTSVLKLIVPLMKLAGPVLGFLVKVIGAVLVPVIKVLINILSAVIGVVLSVTTGIVSAITWLATNWTNIWNAVGAVASKVWNSLWRTVKGTWDAIFKVVSTGLKVVFGIVDFWLGLLLAIFKVGWNALVAIVKLVWGNIWTIIRPAVNMIVNLIKVGWNGVKVISKAAWLLIERFIIDPVKRAVAAVRTAITAVRDWLRGVWNTIRDVARTVWEALRAIVSDKINRAKETVLSVGRTIRDTLAGIWAAVRDKASDLWGKVRDKIIGPVRTAREKVLEIFRRLRDGIAGIWDGIVDKVKAPLRTVFSWINKNIITPLNNKVLKHFGVTLGQLPKLHSGGTVPGSGEKPYMLLGGEGVLNPKATQAIGGPRAIDAINRGAMPQGGITDWVKEHVLDPIGDALAQGAAFAVDVAFRLARAATNAIPGERAQTWARGFLDYLRPVVRQWIIGEEEKQNQVSGAAATGSVTPSVDGWAKVLSGGYRIGRGPAEHGYAARDFPVPTGSSVFAAAAGKVTRSVDLATSYGRHIMVQHGNIMGVYAHLSRRLVQVGDIVRAAQRIGVSGSTGNSTGPHLHLELRPNWDPLAFLRSRGVRMDDGGTLDPGYSLVYNGTGGQERLRRDRGGPNSDTHLLARLHALLARLADNPGVTFNIQGTSEELIGKIERRQRYARIARRRVRA